MWLQAVHLPICHRAIRLHWRTQGIRHGDCVIRQLLGCDCEKTCPNQIQVLEEGKGQEDWCVTNEIKQKCWEQMVKLFEFDLHPTDTEIVMKQALRYMRKMDVFQA